MAINPFNLLTKAFDFILKSFINKTKYPIIALIFFICTIVLNSIQYSHDKNYLQSYFAPYTFGNSPNKSDNFFGNSMIYFLDFIGVNGFIENTPAHIFMCLATYLLLALVELNIGHIGVFYFIVLLTMLPYFLSGYSKFVCDNQTTQYNNFSFCCGSFTLWASLGFCMYVLQKYLPITWRILLIVLMIVIWCILVVNDYLIKKNVCKSFLWHGSNFIFGIFSAIVLSRTNHFLKI